MNTHACHISVNTQSQLWAPSAPEGIAMPVVYLTGTRNGFNSLIKADGGTKI